jgi:hypothetical protein
VTEKDIAEQFKELEEEIEMLKIDISDIIKDRINVVKDVYESDLEFKIDLIKGNYADIQNDSVSDMTIGWNKAIDMVLEILER